MEWRAKLKIWGGGGRGGFNTEGVDGLNFLLVFLWKDASELPASIKL